ncbi:MAG: zinc ribbon domain-containing protein [Polyangia bacterium]|nr:zinc ribbon domain-containing protein [Polyangia bacterium]
MYEFLCTKCKNQFEELVRRGKNDVRCPECQSPKVERLLSRVAFSVGGKFTASTGSSSCSGCSATSCGSCGSAH